MSLHPFLQQAHDHLAAGRWDEAAALCERVLRGDSQNGDAMALRGIVAVAEGDDIAAAQWLSLAVKALPRRWDLYHDLGVVLRRLGRLDDALLRLRKAALLQPDAAAAHYQLGVLLGERGEADDAIAALQRAVACSPEHAKAHAALADMLHGQSRIDEAAAHYERAIAHDDAIALAWYGLGHLRQSAGDHRRAAECFRRCVALDAEMLAGWFGLGCAELASSDNVAAASAFRRCLELNADYAEAHQNLGQALFGLGEIELATDHFRHALFHAGRSQDTRLEELARRSVAVVIPGDPRADHVAVRQARAEWGAMQPARTVPLICAGRSPIRRLRLGYVSAFFGHDNWMKPVWGLINRHDRTRFHVHLLSDGPFEQAKQPGFPPAAYRPGSDDVVCDLTGLDNDAAAKRVAEHGIDILVDLNGYSRMDRLAVFARRPAPIVAAWFNMFATTSLPWFDYLIGDGHVVRPEEEPFYSEKVLRVAGSYLTFSVDYPVPDVAPPPCVKNGFLTFGCLASQYKITPDVLAAWSEILARCPTARVLVKNVALATPSHRNFLVERLGRLSVAPERIELRGPDEHFKFLETYADIDIALDTFPYNGGTTTTEAIWQGVPVVTFAGDRWASRTSATLLREAGLGEWVADDRAGYVDLASAYGGAIDAAGRLAELRQGMRDQLRRSSVCDTATFAASMEELYMQMRPSA